MQQRSEPSQWSQESLPPPQVLEAESSVVETTIVSQISVADTRSSTPTYGDIESTPEEVREPTIRSARRQLQAAPLSLAGDSLDQSPRLANKSIIKFDSKIFKSVRGLHIGMSWTFDKTAAKWPNLDEITADCRRAEMRGHKKCKDHLFTDDNRKGFRDHLFKVNKIKYKCKNYEICGTKGKFDNSSDIQTHEDECVNGKFRRPRYIRSTSSSSTVVVNREFKSTVRELVSETNPSETVILSDISTSLSSIHEDKGQPTSPTDQETTLLTTARYAGLSKPRKLFDVTESTNLKQFFEVIDRLNSVADGSDASVCSQSRSDSEGGVIQSTNVITQERPSKVKTYSKFKLSNFVKRPPKSPTLKSPVREPSESEPLNLTPSLGRVLNVQPEERITPSIDDASNSTPEKAREPDLMSSTVLLDQELKTMSSTSTERPRKSKFKLSNFVKRPHSVRNLKTRVARGACISLATPTPKEIVQSSYIDQQESPPESARTGVQPESARSEVQPESARSEVQPESFRTDVGPSHAQRVGEIGLLWNTIEYREHELTNELRQIYKRFVAFENGRFSFVCSKANLYFHDECHFVANNFFQFQNHLIESKEFEVLCENRPLCSFTSWTSIDEFKNSHSKICKFGKNYIV